MVAHADWIIDLGPGAGHDGGSVAFEGAPATTPHRSLDCPYAEITSTGGLLGWGTCMKLSVVVHEAEEGGYWAEVPSIPGCATQGESFEELLANLYEAVEGCLSVDVSGTPAPERSRVIEIAV